MKIDKHLRYHCTKKCYPSKVYDKVSCFGECVIDYLRIEAFVFYLFVQHRRVIKLDSDVILPFAVLFLARSAHSQLSSIVEFAIIQARLNLLYSWLMV